MGRKITGKSQTMGVKILRKQKTNIPMSKGQKDRIKRLKNNLAKSNIDKDLARDIALTVANNESFYNQRGLPIAKNLSKKKFKGEFNQDLALLAWSNASKQALDTYNKIMTTNIQVNSQTKARIAFELKEEFADLEVD